MPLAFRHYKQILEDWVSYVIGGSTISDINAGIGFTIDVDLACAVDRVNHGRAFLVSALIPCAPMRMCCPSASVR